MNHIKTPDTFCITSLIFDDPNFKEPSMIIGNEFMLLRKEDKLIQIISGAQQICEFISKRDFEKFLLSSEYFLVRKGTDENENEFFLKYFLIALRILKPISSSGNICIHQSGEKIYPTKNFGTVFVSPNYTNNKASLDDLRSAYNIYKKILESGKSQPNRFLIAILYFEITQQRYQAFERYTNAMIVLENFFNTRSLEVTYQISERAAFFLGGNDSRKKNEIFENIKKLYAIRSKIVHGQENPFKELNDKPMLLDQLEAYCREIFIKILSDDNLFQIYTAKKSSAKIDSYFKDLIFGSSTT